MAEIMLQNSSYLCKIFVIYALQAFCENVFVLIFRSIIGKFYFKTSLTPYYDALTFAGFFSNFGNVKLYFCLNCNFRFKNASFVATTALVLSPVIIGVDFLADTSEFSGVQKFF